MLKCNPCAFRTLSGWEELRKEDLNIPKLDIVSSEGVASDAEYVNAYLNHDGLLSTGKEFVHDHHAHMIPLLETILKWGNDRYQMRKSYYVTEIQKMAHRIEIAKKVASGEYTVEFPPERLALVAQNIEVFVTALSAMTDVITNLGSTDHLHDPDHFMSTIAGLSSWGPYMKKKFHYQVDANLLRELWKKDIREIENAYNKSQNIETKPDWQEKGF